MTDHERLREQYEDALFALLMEGVGNNMRTPCLPF